MLRLKSCLSKLNLSSISIQLRVFLKLIMNNKNLSSISIMLIFLNRNITISHSFRRVSHSFVKSLLQRYNISSVKSASSGSFIKRNKLLKNILKRIGPRMDPCGTPNKMI